MRTTITIPDELAQEAQALAGDRALSEFTREALRERVARLKREKLAREMEEGYRAMEMSSPTSALSPKRR